MTRFQRSTIFNMIFETLKKSVDENLDKMPADWTGMELRQYIADQLTKSSGNALLKGEKLRKYKNDKVVNGL